MIKILILTIIAVTFSMTNDSVESVNTNPSVIIEESEQQKEQITEKEAYSADKAFTPLNRDTTRRAPDILPLMKTVKAHFSSGTYNSAFEAVNLALKLDELDYEAVKYKGMIFLITGVIDSAESYLNLAATAEGNDAELDFHMGLLNGAKKRFRTANEHFSRYLQYSRLDPYRERMRKYAAFTAPKAAKEWATEKIETGSTREVVPGTAVWIPVNPLGNNGNIRAIARAIDALIEPALSLIDSTSFIDHYYVRALSKHIPDDAQKIASYCDATRMYNLQLTQTNNGYSLKAGKNQSIFECKGDSIGHNLAKLTDYLIARVNSVSATEKELVSFGNTLLAMDNEDYLSSVNELTILKKKAPKFTLAGELLITATELLEVAEGRTLPSSDKPMRESPPPTKAVGFLKLASASSAATLSLSIATASFMPEKNIAHSNWRHPFLDATNSGSGGTPRRIILTRVPIPDNK